MIAINDREQRIKQFRNIFNLIWLLNVKSQIMPRKIIDASNTKELNGECLK